MINKIHIIAVLDMWQMGAYEISLVSDQKYKEMEKYRIENPKSNGFYFHIKEIELTDQQYSEITYYSKYLAEGRIAKLEEYRDRIPELSEKDKKAIFGDPNEPTKETNS